MTNKDEDEKKIVRPLTQDALENVELMYGQVVALVITHIFSR